MKAIRWIYLASVLLNAPFTFAQGTAFTYQGRLNFNTVPANGNYDFQFVLRDAANGGNGFGTNQIAPVAVNNGIFTVTLDFGGAAFDGNARWLQINVRTNGSAGPYTSLSPRQAITPGPYAIHAADSTIPAGTISAYMGTNAPSGWLICDGTAVSRATYSRLFGVVGVSSGSGNGSTTFNLPDLRATFLRGMDGDAEIDLEKFQRTAARPGGNTGNALGSMQLDAFKSHHHANGAFNAVMKISFGGPGTVTTTDATGYYEPNLLEAAPMMNAGFSETRPRNIYVNYIIKL